MGDLNADERGWKSLREITETRDGLPDRDFHGTMPPGEIAWSALKYYNAKVIEWLGWAAMAL